MYTKLFFGTIIGVNTYSAYYIYTLSQSKTPIINTNIKYYLRFIK